MPLPTRPKEEKAAAVPATDGRRLFQSGIQFRSVKCLQAEGELGNRPWVNPGRMWSDEYPYGPKPHGDQMELLYRGEMRPTAEDFRSFCHNAGCEISARNVNITDTLDALERYDRRVEELQRIPAKSARDREELLQTLETRRQLQKLMDSAYDVRGHRTAGRILDDPAERVILEGVPLYGPHRSVLKEGLGLYLPHESGNNPSHAYAWVDQATDGSSSAATRLWTGKPSGSDRRSRRGCTARQEKHVKGPGHVPKCKIRNI